MPQWFRNPYEFVGPPLFFMCGCFPFQCSQLPLFSVGPFWRMAEFPRSARFAFLSIDPGYEEVRFPGSSFSWMFTPSFLGGPYPSFYPVFSKQISLSQGCSVIMNFFSPLSSPYTTFLWPVFFFPSSPHLTFFQGNCTTRLLARSLFSPL